MKDLFTVMKFTMKDMVKRKSFIISTIIFLVMIIVGFNVPKILKSIKGEDTVDKLLIVDESNVFEGALESLKKLDTGYEIEIANLKYDEVKEKIQSEEIESAIFVEKQEENIKIKYIVKDAKLKKEKKKKIISKIKTVYTKIQKTK